jgi:hypothetical protein
MKNKLSCLNKLHWFLIIMASITVVHHFVLRPRFLNWGASENIQSLAFPGDKFTDGKGDTRAVLIRATPEEIWPWIVQLGQDRGGMYSYVWLENLVKADMHNVYELKEQLQTPREAGDTVWLANPERYNGQGYQILAMVVPNEAFVMMGGEDYNRILTGEKAYGTWSIYLYPENPDFTWLIARSSDDDFPVGSRILRYFVYEVPHFIMETKMLKTMKRLAEQ